MKNSYSKTLSYGFMEQIFEYLSFERNPQKSSKINRYKNQPESNECLYFVFKTCKYCNLSNSCDWIFVVFIFSLAKWQTKKGNMWEWRVWAIRWFWLDSLFVIIVIGGTMMQLSHWNWTICAYNTISRAIRQWECKREIDRKKVYSCYQESWTL